MSRVRISRVFSYLVTARLPAIRAATIAALISTTSCDLYVSLEELVCGQYVALLLLVTYRAIDVRVCSSSIVGTDLMTSLSKIKVSARCATRQRVFADETTKLQRSNSIQHR